MKSCSLNIFANQSDHFHLLEINGKFGHARSNFAGIPLSGSLLNRRANLCNSGETVAPAGSAHFVAEGADGLVIQIFQGRQHCARIFASLI